MEDLILLYFAWTGLLIFKYSAFQLAKASGLNPWLTLIPIVDIYYVFKSFNNGKYALLTLLLLPMCISEDMLAFIVMVSPIITFFLASQAMERKTFCYYLVGSLFIINSIILAMSLGFVVGIISLIGSFVYLGVSSYAFPFFWWWRK